MAPMETYDDEWIASVMTYVRRSWGNTGEPVHPRDVEEFEVGIKRTTAFTLAELNMPTRRESKY